MDTEKKKYKNKYMGGVLKSEKSTKFARNQQKIQESRNSRKLEWEWLLSMATYLYKAH